MWNYRVVKPATGLLNWEVSGSYDPIDLQNLSEEQMLERMGEGGWELASVVPTPRAMAYYFKRPSDAMPI